jgi:ABC transporter substrate binding protein
MPISETQRVWRIEAFEADNRSWLFFFGCTGPPARLQCPPYICPETPAWSKTDRAADPYNVTSGPFPINLRALRRVTASQERGERYATELVELAPDVILATGTATMAPLLQATRTIPIVFVSVADPVGAGFVDSLARPGGNATGFIQFEYTLSGKWLELLKHIAPGVTRVAVLRDAAITSGLANSP